MHPAKVVRTRVRQLTDLPNVGPAMVRDLHLLEIMEPDDLLGQNGRDLYDRLCQLTATRHDPCVLDVLLSITAFMAGEAPQPWWQYTAGRKLAHPDL